MCRDDEAHGIETAALPTLERVNARTGARSTSMVVCEMESLW